MKRDHRIECAKHHRSLIKNYDSTGEYLEEFTNWVGDQGCFNVCATEDSEYEGKPIAVTVIISNHDSWDEAESALLTAVQALGAVAQVNAYEHISTTREAGKALESKVRRQAAYVKRRLEINLEQRQKRRLGYFD